MFGTHIAIYLTNAGNTRTPLHENSPNQVTNSETSPGPPPATAVHPSRGPCPGRKSTVNFPTSLTLPDCRYPLPTAIPKHPEPPPLKTAACHGGLPFCPFPGRSLIFCHVYCPPDENWTEFLTFQIRTESAEAAESGGAGHLSSASSGDPQNERKLPPLSCPGARHGSMTASTRHTLLSGVLRVFFQDHPWCLSHVAHVLLYIKCTR